MSGFRGLLAELRRRNVLRIATAYVVTAWLLLQVASIILPAFLAPAWVMQGVTVLLAAGFPLAIILAWIFQLSAGGVVRDEGPETVDLPTGTSGRWLDFSIIGVLVIAVALFAYDEFVIEKETPDRRPAIAIIPFDVDASDDTARVLADGLATELIFRLSEWSNFPVLARAATFDPELPKNVAESGALLDALYSVSGSFQIIGDRIRVRVSLVNTEAQQTLWSETFEHDVKNIVSLENEISRDIVGKLSPQLLESESARAMRADPKNLDAWKAAHRGWWHVNTETREGYEAAMVWFDQAIEMDPNWGWPYAAKGILIYRSFLNGWLPRAPDNVEALYENATRAVALDPMDAFAHHALGHAYGAQMRRDDSINALARGVELSPHDAMAWSCYGMQLAAANRPEEAIAAAEKALSLSPKDPWMHRHVLVLARASFAVGNYRKSEELALRSIQLKPNFGAMIHSIAAAAKAGDIATARQRVIDARANGPLPPIEGLEKYFSAEAESDYGMRIIDGLRLADFSTAGKDQSETG